MNENHGQRADDRDDVARLVRLAGKRREVPVDRAARVRAAARVQWQAEVQSRSKKRLVWGGAGLAAAAILGLTLTLWVLGGGGTGPATDGPILVESLQGSAWVVGADQRSALGLGGKVARNDTIETAESSRMALRLASGHSVRLDGSTRLRLLDNGSIALDRGAVYVDSGFETQAAGDLEVHTPFGVIEEIGTQFEVRLEAQSVRVRLREGAVVVHHGKQDHEVRVGHELSLAADGTVTRLTIGPNEAAWDWVAGVAPMLDLEGRTARSFLDWIARERGWTLAFSDETVARSADRIVLSGTTERLTLDQVLDAVLPTCRMTHRVENDLLVVSGTTADAAGS